MGWVRVGTAVFGAPRLLAKMLENTAFFRKKLQNRGAPKTAIPTTTHPIPDLMHSEIFLAVWAPVSVSIKLPQASQLPCASGSRFWPF